MKLNYHRVLIVDDEPDHRLIIRLLLHKFWSPELLFVEVGSGREAVFLAQNWQPDLILINLKLPEMDGYEVIRQIRAIKPSRIAELGDSTPPNSPWIVAMSTDIRRSQRDRAFAAGCTTFLRKPFWIDDLVAQLPNTILPANLLDPEAAVIVAS